MKTFKKQFTNKLKTLKKTPQTIQQHCKQTKTPFKPLKTIKKHQTPIKKTLQQHFKNLLKTIHKPLKNQTKP